MVCIQVLPHPTIPPWILHCMICIQVLPNPIMDIALHGLHPGPTTPQHRTMDIALHDMHPGPTTPHHGYCTAWYASWSYHTPPWILHCMICIQVLPHPPWILHCMICIRVLPHRTMDIALHGMYTGSTTPHHGYCTAWFVSRS